MIDQALAVTVEILHVTFEPLADRKVSQVEWRRLLSPSAGVVAQGESGVAGAISTGPAAVRCPYSRRLRLNHPLALGMRYRYWPPGDCGGGGAERANGMARFSWRDRGSDMRWIRG